MTIFSKNLGGVAPLPPGYAYGCNEVRRRPGQDASLAPPCSNLRSFGSKCTVLKKALVTFSGPPAVIQHPRVIRRSGNFAPTRYAPVADAFLTLLNCFV